MAAPASPVAAARGLGLRLALRGATAHRCRLVRTVAAVALAVSLVSGTFVLTDTINAVFRDATEPRGVDVVVRTASEFTPTGTSVSERARLPELVLEIVRAIPGVAEAWGQVTGYAALAGADGDAIAPTGLPALGTAWAPDATIVAGRAPSGPDEVVIDEETARRDDLQIGDRINVLFGNLIEEYRIAGLRKLGNLIASAEATFDLTTAQRVLGQLGWLDAISVTAAEGVDPEALRARIGEVIDPTYEVVTSDQAAREASGSWSDALGFLTTALLVFAGVALLVGAFIITNTFSILVSQRVRELGLLRALGGSRGRLLGSVLVEALVVGVLASATGIALGLGAAHGLLALLGAVGLEVPARGVVLRPRAAWAGMGAGVLVTVFAALAPAWRATRISPVAAITGTDTDGPGPGSHDPDRAGGPDPVRRAAAWGAAVAAAGAVCLLIGLEGEVRDPVLATGTGAAAILVGVALVTPAVAGPAARVLGYPLAALRGEPARLGRENAMRHPRRTAATAGALMIGISLVGVVAILGESMKASAARTIGETMRSDFVVTTAEAVAGTGGVPEVVAGALRETAGVATVSEIRGGQWGLEGRTATLLAVDPATVVTMYDLDPASAAAARMLTDTSVLVRDTVARRHGWAPGDQVPMTFARTGTQPFRIAATFSTTAVRSDYVITLDAHEANYLHGRDLQIDVLLADGVSEEEGRARLDDALAPYPGIVARDRSEVLAAQEREVDQILVPVTALLALSVAIALLGIANTLSLAVHERRRELGLLRAVGMTRGQVRSMVRSEAFVVTVLGATLGLGLALFFGWVLVRSLAGLGVTELVVPTGQLGALVLAVAGAGVLASVLAARRTARLDVLAAIASD